MLMHGKMRPQYFLVALLWTLYSLTFFLFFVFFFLFLFLAYLLLYIHTILTIIIGCWTRSQCFHSNFRIIFFIFSSISLCRDKCITEISHSPTNCHRSTPYETLIQLNRTFIYCSLCKREWHLPFFLYFSVALILCLSLFPPTSLSLSRAFISQWHMPWKGGTYVC